MTSLLIAQQYQIPEVMICFHNKLLRGNRTRKVNSTEMFAFDSPNCGHLADIGVNFNVHWHNMLNHQSYGPFTTFKNMRTDIATYSCSPMFDLDICKAIF